MQKLIIIFFTILNLSLKAECNSQGIYVWPKDSIVSQNSIFIIEGYFFSQNSILKCNEKNTYLKSGNEKIPLKVFKLFKSQFDLTQVLLKPTKNLTMGKTYYLILDSIDETFRPIKYICQKKPDIEIPIWNCDPQYIGKSFINYGCGPAREVHFCININDESKVFVFTKVKNLKTNLSSCYYLTCENNSINIGHDMCAGAFYFGKDSMFEVQFSLIDQSGNENNIQSKSFPFKAPTIIDENREFNTNCDCINSQRKTYFIYFIIGIIILIIILFLVVLKRNTNQ